MCLIVYTLWKFPGLLPVFTTWPDVLNKISSGAGKVQYHMLQCNYFIKHVQVCSCFISLIKIYNCYIGYNYLVSNTDVKSIQPTTYNKTYN